MPAPDLIRHQLDRILSSREFANAARHRRLLQYLVERTLASEGERLKEYVVATEVFDRPETYDPRLDSIVRVEMRRLRARLEEYYRESGAADLVTISIRRGAYAPLFSARQSPAASPDPAPRTPRTWPHISRIAWGAGLTLAVVALLVGVFRMQPARTAAAEADSVPGIAVLPFESYSSIADHRLLAGRVTDAVTTELATLESVSVASRTSTAHYAGEPRRMGELAAALNVRFAVEASATFEDERLRVVARLVDAARDRKVWVGVYHLTPAEIGPVSRHIAGELAAAAFAQVASQKRLPARE